ncbi:Predicted PurR-regulated permease PerM [Pelagirhabdus alkalitolerans]|uniref:Predicted PurR-regulated permease PerM n=2 Tax=Pelagirhabdus alkalitolerans TaxID=1612202 RepID=A0A1G6HSL2_9BACI|nr:Predicted PurR-regulated permease PerM [Pelagirhabdus alkalitolerans]
MIEPIRHLAIKLMIPLALAFLIACLLKPIMNQLIKWSIPKYYSVAIIYVSVILIFSLFVMVIYPVLVEQIELLIKEVQTLSNHYSDTINMWVRRLPQTLQDDGKQFTEAIESRVILWIEDRLTLSFTYIDYLISLFAIPILVHYFLIDSEVFIKTCLKRLSPLYREEVYKWMTDLYHYLIQYVRSQILLSIIVGVLTGVVYFLFQLPHKLMLMLFMMIMNLIPFIGPLLGGLPAAFMMAAQDSRRVIYLIIALVIVQIIESQLLSPIIFGRRLLIHPVAIIVSLIIFQEWFGFIGMVFAVPILIVIKRSWPFVKRLIWIDR